MSKDIWTIGHSTRTFDEFVKLLQIFNISTLVDVRRFPGSRRYPHFGRDFLQENLPTLSIDYHYLQKLGGRRKPHPDSQNTVWRNASFRAYADYMETAEFQEGIEELKETGTAGKTAYMCSEAVWWRCHRSMVSDQMKADGWKVLHILTQNKADEHPFTKPARIVDGELTYRQPGLFDNENHRREVDGDCC